MDQAPAGDINCLDLRDNTRRKRSIDQYFNSFAGYGLDHGLSYHLCERGKERNAENDVKRKGDTQRHA